jgi:hypothetical protein
MWLMRGSSGKSELSGASGHASLWRLAAHTVARTLLWFTLPYLLAYYSVMGAWHGVRALLLLLR